MSKLIQHGRGFGSYLPLNRKIRSQSLRQLKNIGGRVAVLPPPVRGGGDEGARGADRQTIPAIIF